LDFKGSNSNMIQNNNSNITNGEMGLENESNHNLNESSDHGDTDISPMSHVKVIKHGSDAKIKGISQVIALLLLANEETCQHGETLRNYLRGICKIIFVITGHTFIAWTVPGSDMTWAKIEVFGYKYMIAFQLKSKILELLVNDFESSSELVNTESSTSPMNPPVNSHSISVDVTTNDFDHAGSDSHSHENDSEE